MGEDALDGLAWIGMGRDGSGWVGMGRAVHGGRAAGFCVINGLCSL